MGKNKRIILHIGTVKAGSSSIQDTMGSNRKKLLNHNIYYPSNKPYNHIARFVPIFLDNPKNSIFFIKKGIVKKEDIEKKCNFYKNIWINEFKKCNCDNFIISAETLSISMTSEKSLLRIKKFLSIYFEEIDIIIYMRHYNTLLASEIQQVVKNGRESVKLPDLLKKLIEKENSYIYYRNNIKKWIEVFGMDKIIVRPFDKSVFKNGNLIDDFLFSLGFNINNIDINEIRANESIGENAVTFLERFNQKYPEVKNGKRNPERGLVSQHMPKKAFRVYNDEKFSPKINYTKQQAKKLNKEIDYINQFFEDGYAFEHIKAVEEKTVFKKAEDIPVDFFVELINNYNKRIEELLMKNEELKKDNNYTMQSDLGINIYLLNSKSILITSKNLLRYTRYKIFGLEGFDINYYIKRYPYVTDRVKDPLLHFLIRGVYRGYNPNASFNTKKYLHKYPEIIASGDNALIHYNKRKKRTDGF